MWRCLRSRCSGSCSPTTCCTLYIFWELVGVCSFLLIGFWYQKPEAKAAAKKAFIVTRIGDVGLLIALLLLFWYMPDHALDLRRDS